jgi:CRISPR-associated protein Csm4
VDIYLITIKPESPFGTPLKGDTIFGHVCWQAAHDQDLLNGGLDKWMAPYPSRPFAVFSSAWPMIIEGGIRFFGVPRPTLPLKPPADTETDTKDRFARMQKIKAEKRKKWLLIAENNLTAGLDQNLGLTDENLFDKHVKSVGKEEIRRTRGFNKKQKRLINNGNQAHNTINRLTMTTGEAAFAPYMTENTFYYPGMELAVFAAIDTEALNQKHLQSCFERIGQWGYGRDATTGLGRFSLGEVEKIDWPQFTKDKACYTLAPCVPQPSVFCQSYFKPFIRFGRHGDRLVHSGNPFKNPVIMADEGAVFYPAPEIELEMPFIGRGVTNISKADPRAVTQGYALYLPCSRRN